MHIFPDFLLFSHIFANFAPFKRIIMSEKFPYGYDVNAYIISVRLLSLAV